VRNAQYFLLVKYAPTPFILTGLPMARQGNGDEADEAPGVALTSGYWIKTMVDAPL
jgi:hypothetical protein